MLEKNIIVRRIKRGQDHVPHRGAWKVAYADFVTAMMAFFLLLWLVSVTDQSTLQGVAQYFTPAEPTDTKLGVDQNGVENNTTDNTGMGVHNVASSALIHGAASKGYKLDNIRAANNNSEMEKIHFLSVMNAIQRNSELQGFTDNVQMNITSEGLQIQVMDMHGRPIFKPNTSELQPYMKKIIDVIAKIIQGQPNYIAITGHTAATSSSSGEGAYADLWQVSTARANEVRKYLTRKLISPEQVLKIIGRADTEPFDEKNPHSVQNMRIDITLLNNSSIGAYQQSIPNEPK